MPFRTCTIIVLAVAALAGGGLGTSNGTVLCVDGDGHLAVEAPHEVTPTATWKALTTTRTITAGTPITPTCTT